MRLLEIPILKLRRMVPEIGNEPIRQPTYEVGALHYAILGLNWGDISERIAAASVYIRPVA